MPFWDSVSTNEDRVHAALLELLDLDADRVRHLLPCERERLLAHELRDPRLEREVGRLALAEVERPFGEQRDEVVAKRFRALRPAWR